MKYPVNIAAIFAVMSVLFSCKKDNASSGSSIRKLSDLSQSSIIGKWNIVTDSSYTGFAQYQQPLDYDGKAGDYFNFSADGHIYTKEGNVLDTLTYNITSSNKMIISSFGGTLNDVPEISNITTTSANQMIIFSPWIYTPGGVMGRKVTLSH